MNKKVGLSVLLSLSLITCTYFAPKDVAADTRVHTTFSNNIEIKAAVNTVPVISVKTVVSDQPIMEEVKEVKKVEKKEVQKVSQKVQPAVKETVKKEEPKKEVIKEKPVVSKPVETKPVEKETVIDNNAVSSALLNQLNNKAIALINNTRSHSLSVNATLNKYASTRAYEASVKWSHTRPNGSRGVNMIDASKYRGENLAKTVIYDFDGSSSQIDAVATRLVNNWTNSVSHYKNMTFEQFTQIGLKTYVVVDGNKYIFYSAAMFSN